MFYNSKTIQVHTETESCAPGFPVGLRLAGTPPRSSSNSFQTLVQPADCSPASKKPVTGKPGNSVIWKHFKEEESDPRVAECLYCTRKVSRDRVVGHLINTSMTQHMKAHHNSILLQAEAGIVGCSGFPSTPPHLPPIHHYK